MRVCDAGRDGVAAALGEHVQTGRLTGEELDERTGRALRARTLAELDELTADVPAIRPAGPAPVARPRGLGYPLVAPVAAALAALAIAALVPGVGDGRHGWPSPTGNPGRTDRAANRTQAPQPRQRHNGAWPGNRAHPVRWSRPNAQVHLLTPPGTSAAPGP